MKELIYTITFSTALCAVLVVAELIGRLIGLEDFDDQ